MFENISKSLILQHCGHTVLCVWQVNFDRTKIVENAKKFKWGIFGDFQPLCVFRFGKGLIPWVPYLPLWEKKWGLCSRVMGENWWCWVSRNFFIKQAQQNSFAQLGFLSANTYRKFISICLDLIVYRWCKNVLLDRPSARIQIQFI